MAIIYLRFNAHRKYIFIGRENNARPKNNRKEYRVAPSLSYKSFNFVRASKNGGTTK